MNPDDPDLEPTPGDVARAVPFSGPSDPAATEREAAAAGDSDELGFDDVPDLTTADPIDEFRSIDLAWYSDEEPDVDDRFDPTHGHGDIDHPDLYRLREFCLMLPEAGEVAPFGLPTFRVGGKAFAMFEFRDTRPVLCFKIEVEQQRELVVRDGFWPHPDTGHHGWTFVYLDIGLDWEDEVDEYVVFSYRLVAKPEYVIQLDNLLRE
jgi:predicted DNA-binding protein (MmcQ/YjbR family)